MKLYRLCEFTVEPGRRKDFIVTFLGSDIHEYQSFNLACMSSGTVWSIPPPWKYEIFRIG